jgi:hypothetical protein
VYLASLRASARPSSQSVSLLRRHGRTPPTLCTRNVVHPEIEPNDQVLLLDCLVVEELARQYHPARGLISRPAAITHEKLRTALPSHYLAVRRSSSSVNPTCSARHTSSSLLAPSALHHTPHFGPGYQLPNPDRDAFTTLCTHPTLTFPKSTAGLPGKFIFHAELASPSSSLRWLTAR